MVMRKHRYDQYLERKTDPEALLDQLRAIMDVCEAGAFVDHRAALKRNVRDWFLNHFKTNDARLSRMLDV
jgi:hypothetical protein